MQLRPRSSPNKSLAVEPSSSDWSVSSPVRRTSPRKSAIPFDDDEAEDDNDDIVNQPIASSDPSEVDILSDSGFQVPLQKVSDDFTLQGILSEEEARVQETFPGDSDRQLFESAFLRAESALQQQRLKYSSPTSAAASASANRRLQSSRQYSAALSSSSQLQQQQPAGRGKGKDLFSILKKRVQSSSAPQASIRKVYFGTDFAINPWYSAPYPSEYHSESGELWICEFCLKYMNRACTAQRHLSKCHGRLPPGDEIYRDTTAGISVFEVNGRDAKLYCQNLCLLAKMFLDHKTLYYDVDPFLFYVLVEWKQLGTGRFLNSFVGYFSKEKVNPASYNVSCILTMPHHQRKGYGAFLIDFSYLLSRREGRLGTPEKPLSDLGLFSYVGYWKQRVLGYLSSVLPEDLNSVPNKLNATCNVALISAATGMTENDILATLEYLRMLRFDPIQDPQSGLIRLRVCVSVDKAQIEAYRERLARLKPLVAKESLLRWEPYRCLR